MKLAELVVDIVGNQAPLNRTLGVVHQKLGMAGASLAGAVTGGLAALGAGAAFKSAVTGAMELQDVMSRNRAILGSSAGLVEAQADQMAEAFGTVKQEYMDAAGSFGAMFKGTGSTEEDAAKLGNMLTQLGMDMASFKGGVTTNADAFGALASAMRGEMDPIEQFNVRLSAEKIALEAVALGLAKNKNHVSDYAKSQATLSLIMKQTEDQQGNLADTIDEGGNPLKQMMGNLTNLGTTIGEAVLPPLNEAINAINAHMGPVLETVGFTLRNFGDIWEIVQLQIGMAIDNAVSYVEAFVANLGIVADYVGNNWVTLIFDAGHAIERMFANLATNIGGFASAIWNFLQDPTGGFNFDWTPMLDGFKAATTQLPELIRPDLNKAQGLIDEKLAKIGENEEKRRQEKAAQAAALAEGGLAGPAGGAMGGGQGKGGTTDALAFARELQAGFLGKDRVQENQLEVQKKMLEQLKKPGAMGAIAAVAAP